MLIVLAVPTATDRFVLEPSTNSSNATRTGFKHPIVIFQHNCRCGSEAGSRLAEVSIQQHQQYADAHGYKMRANYGNYVPSDESLWKGDAHFNKMFGVLQIMLEELAKDPVDRMEWIV